MKCISLKLLPSREKTVSCIRNFENVFLELSSIAVERLFYEIAAELIEQARQKAGGLSKSHHDSSVTNLGIKNNLGNFQSSCCGGGSGGQ